MFGITTKWKRPVLLHFRSFMISNIGANWEESKTESRKRERKFLIQYRKDSTISTAYKIDNMQAHIKYAHIEQLNKISWNYWFPVSELSKKQLLMGLYKKESNYRTEIK